MEALFGERGDGGRRDLSFGDHRHERLRPILRNPNAHVRAAMKPIRTAATQHVAFGSVLFDGVRTFDPQHLFRKFKRHISRYWITFERPPAALLLANHITHRSAAEDTKRNRKEQWSHSPMLSALLLSTSTTEKTIVFSVARLRQFALPRRCACMQTLCGETFEAEAMAAIRRDMYAELFEPPTAMRGIAGFGNDGSRFASGASRSFCSMLADERASCRTATCYRRAPPS
jgi:hypothetical protein